MYYRSILLLHAIKMEQDTSKTENNGKSLDSQGSDGGGSGDMKPNKHDKKGKNDRRKSAQNGRTKEKLVNGVTDVRLVN